jgi:sucrose phosphorylase
VRSIGKDYDVMVDVIVNHVSSRSPQFLDWLLHGPDSAFDGMFLTMGSAFPDGAREEDLLRPYRPRPGVPFTPYTFADGSQRLVWTTFTAQQVDLDISNAMTREYLARVLDRLAEAQSTCVRLDAVGYAVKTPGSNSFMTPETFAFIDEISGWCRQRGLEVLVEVHSYYRRQVEIAQRVDRVYDFAIPPLLLHTLSTGDADALVSWLQIRPTNAVTVLDTHDGIGVIDVGADPLDRSQAGLLTPAQIDRLVETMHHNSGDTSRHATGAAATNVDLYQVNCTFYDALGGDDARYLLARAVQFFAPGIPQVYYVGLLAGSNDMELLAETHVGRDVNRHHYTREEIDAAVARPVVAALFRLIRFRNAHPAFEGEFHCEGGGSRLAMSWRKGANRASLVADVGAATATLSWTDGDQSHSVDDLVDLPG